MRNWLLPLLILSASCGAEVLPPIPRFSVSPSYLCEGDEPQRVILDASAARAADGGPPDELEIRWHLEPEPVEILSGDLSSPRLSCRFATDRPIRTRLVVTAPTGQSAEQARTIGLTRSARVPCTGGCEVHEICVNLEGAAICVDDRTCHDDEDCEPCGVCLPDDGGTLRCVSP